VYTCILIELEPLSCRISALTIEELPIHFHVLIIVNVVLVVRKLLNSFLICLCIILSLPRLTVAVYVYDTSILNGLVVACIYLLVLDLSFLQLSIIGVQECVTIIGALLHVQLILQHQVNFLFEIIDGTNALLVALSGLGDIIFLDEPLVVLSPDVSKAS
jgi:hypothetical protein